MARLGPEAATRIPFRPLQTGGTDEGRAALTFNPANCRGTVLAVNGFRRYFHMYHPLLPGSKPQLRVGVSVTRQVASRVGYNKHPFVGNSQWPRLTAVK